MPSALMSRNPVAALRAALIRALSQGFSRRRVPAMGRAVFLGMTLVLLSASHANSQWSRDPQHALQLPNIPHGYNLTTDSLGGVFVLGADWDVNFTYCRTYCTYIGGNGENRWDRWISLIPEADIDYPTSTVICPEPGYFVALQLTEHRSNEDTSWDFRAQKLDSEGQRLWPDSGASISDRELRYEDNAAFKVVGVVGDSEGGVIVLWEIWYYRWVTDVDNILVRQSFHAQRLSPDGERLWGESGVEVIPDDNGRDAFNGRVVSDGDGGVIWVYSKYDNIGGQHISSDGNSQWGASGVRYGLNSYLISSSAVSDNQGGVIFSGQGVRDSLKVIRAFRLDPDGNQLWGDGNGLAVREVWYRTGGVGASWLINATDSIFFINWEERVAHPYVQTLDLSGQLLYNSPGITISDSATVGLPAVGIGSFQSTIYGWLGSRPSEGGQSAFYCQRFNCEGKKMWPGEGTMLFDRTRMSIARVLTDCYGGAIFQIGPYLQLVNPNGELGVPLTIRSIDQPLAPGIIEYSFFPNPTNGSITLSFLSPLITDRQVELFDLQGRVISMFQIPSGITTHPMDLSDYPSGSYILQILPDAPGSHRTLNIIK